MSGRKQLCCILKAQPSISSPPSLYLSFQIKRKKKINKNPRLPLCGETEGAWCVFVWRCLNVNRWDTHMLCSTHQPQCGSPELRHSPQVPYCSHDSMGTCVTWKHTFKKKKNGSKVIDEQTSQDAHTEWSLQVCNVTALNCWAHTVNTHTVCGRVTWQLLPSSSAKQQWAAGISWPEKAVSAINGLLSGARLHLFTKVEPVQTHLYTEEQWQQHVLRPTLLQKCEMCQEWKLL